MVVGAYWVDSQSFCFFDKLLKLLTSELFYVGTGISPNQVKIMLKITWKYENKNNF